MPVPPFYDRSRSSSSDESVQEPTVALLHGEKLLYTDDIEKGHRTSLYSRDTSPSRLSWFKSAVPTTTLATCLRSLLAFMIFFIPSPITNRFFPQYAAAPEKVHKTAWLDGLRGAAAVCVAIFHFANAIYQNTITGWGVHDDYSFIKFPIIRLLYSGPFAVCLFFVISGFALSIKPVEYMQDGTHDAKRLFKTLNSAAFRRPFRLYIPAFASAFLVFLLLATGVTQSQGLKDIAKSVKTQHTSPSMVSYSAYGYPFLKARDAAQGIEETGGWEHIMELFSTWFVGCVHMLRVFDNRVPAEKQGHPLNSPLWSIIVEFKASILLFVVHFALSGLRQVGRLVSTMVLLFFSVYIGSWDMVLFIGGFGLAQLEHIIPSFEQRAIAVNKNRQRLWTLLHTLCLLGGLFLASYPDHYASSSPGFKVLSHLVPKSYGSTEAPRFWQGMGAILIVYALTRLPNIARLFATPSMRYIGKISFGFYLVHSTVIITWGVTALYLVWQFTGRENVIMNAIGFAVATGLLIIPVIIWVADIFTRAIDAPSVRFARWLESLFIRKE